MRRLALLILAAMLSLNAVARQETLLNSDWHFKTGDVTNAPQPDLDTGDWESISIPHNWGWQEAQQGKNYYRGPGWYRRALNVAPERGRRYFLRFEAAGSAAEVYLNGKSLGRHRGGFGAFSFEITRALSPSGTNLLAVRVSNAADPDITPLSGDFCVFGGLYRSVHLIETADQNVTLTDHGSPGVAWMETSVDATQAVLDVKVQVSNGTGSNCPLTLVAVVRDAACKPVAEAAQKITSTANVTEPFSLRVLVREPHLWNGRKDPYLYRAAVELQSDGAVVDAVEQPLGVRSFFVDPDRGFFLNGRPYHLHGVNRHQDRQDKGWAISESDQDEDMAMILEMGCTVIRCAHYQHSDYFYNLCDKAGLLVWAELSQVDKIGAGQAFADTSRSQWLDLIRQNINHPSIFAWSFFNELRPGNPDPHRLLLDLNELAHGEDPTRPTIAATCTDKLPQMNKIPDLLGWNIYPGWYPDWGPLSDYPRHLDPYRTTSQHGGFCVSEYGAGANINQHEDNPKAPVARGQWHPEEWQAIHHEEAWAQMKQRPFVWGTFAWNMFDFTSYWRKEGGILGRNDKGMVTYDRKVKKDAFYFYKANWSDEPTLYITSRRFTERTNATTNVKIYSNAGEVELLLNGASQGSKSQGTNGVFVWSGVSLRPGENRVEARAQRDGRKLTDSCVWALRNE